MAAYHRVRTADGEAVSVRVGRYMVTRFATSRTWVFCLVKAPGENHFMAVAGVGLAEAFRAARRKWPKQLQFALRGVVGRG